MHGVLAAELLETFRHELPENTYENRDLEKACVRCLALTVLYVALTVLYSGLDCLI